MKQKTMKLFAGSLVVASFSVLAQATFAASLGSMQNPIPVSVIEANSRDYRMLQGTGSVVYYRMAIPQPMTRRLVITIPRSTPTKFVPQVVLFEPNEETFGPLLPIQQPPQTLGLVYGRTPARVVFDASTQVLVNTTLEANLRFPVTGMYILAVYNAGSAQGVYKLLLNPSPQMMSWNDTLTYPKLWMQDQLFAGFGWLTCIAPILLLLSGWAVYLLLDRYRLHPHKIYLPVKKVTPPVVKPDAKRKKK